MFAADGTVGADQRALDIAEDRVDVFERRGLGGPIALARDLNDVVAARVDKPSKARQAVGYHRRSRYDDALRQRHDTFAFEACDALKPDALGFAVLGRLRRAKTPPQFDRRDPLLGLRELIYGAKSRRQRHFGLVENGARGE